VLAAFFQPAGGRDVNGVAEKLFEFLVIRIRSKRELSWLKSMSLSGRSSPQATEPNRRTRLA
jgi:hypothetical protein